ncbi:uncharacterized protein LOC123499968 [Portunus trituberculatus]|uniref:uncharacterized protein LOC123499968 n=1 Tax=Portunus trituberculatus TaxID=210409 RepID=UPI001E1CFC40|nr:uncharacterized protein LOC123499968 [Portunus trituberculatus]
MLDADPPIDEIAPFIHDVKEAVTKFRVEKQLAPVTSVRSCSKWGSETMIRGLHAVLTALWHSGTIPPDWKNGLVIPIWKGKGDRQDCSNCRGITLLSEPGKVLAHFLLMHICSHLLKHQRPEKSGFTPGKLTTDQRS